MKILGQLENACIEQLGADPGVNTQGRMFANTADGHVKIDMGAAKRSVLLNDEKAIIGLSGTASQNIRFHRMAAEILQLVKASDAAADGSPGTLLAQLSAKFENYTSAGRPAFGSPGRIIYLTDLKTISVDIGTAWKDLGLDRPVITSSAASQGGAIGDGTRYMDASAAPITYTPPSASQAGSGAEIELIKTDSTFNVITVLVVPTSLNSRNERIVLQSNGTVWRVKSRGANLDWTAATFGVSGGLSDNGGAMTQNSFIRREGDSLRCKVNLFNIGVGAADAQVVLPSSLVADTSKIVNKQMILGLYNKLYASGEYYDSFAARGAAGLVAMDTALPDTVYLSFSTTAGKEYSTFTANSWISTGDGLCLDFVIPISGWH